MKIIVQNGASHGLSRRKAEALVELFPSSWSNAIKALTLYQGEGPAVEFRHYPKEQSFGMFWPPASCAQPVLAEAVGELLVALAIVVEQGSLPQRVSSSLRRRAEQSVCELASRCNNLLEHNDA